MKKKTAYLALRFALGLWICIFSAKHLLNPLPAIRRFAIGFFTEGLAPIFDFNNLVLAKTRFMY